MASFLKTTVFECPADGCAWKITSTELDALKVAQGYRWQAKIVTNADGSMNIDIGGAAEESAKADERILREHLETHDVLDWVRTVVNRDQQIYNLGHTGIRPHVYDFQPGGHNA